MRKIVFFISILAAMASAGESTIKAGVGAVLPTTAIFNFANDFSTGMANVLMGEGTDINTESDFPVFFASYDYTLLGHLGIGAAFAYDHYHSDIKMSGWYNGNGGTRTEDYFTIAATARLNYMNFTYVRLYGLLDGGVTILRQTDEWDFDKTENDTTTHYDDSDRSYSQFFNFQLTPLGVEVGNSFGGFAEIGFGYRGMFTAGAFARF